MAWSQGIWWFADSDGHDLLYQMNSNDATFWFLGSNDLSNVTQISECLWLIRWSRQSCVGATSGTRDFRSSAVLENPPVFQTHGQLPLDQTDSLIEYRTNLINNTYEKRYHVILNSIIHLQHLRYYCQTKYFHIYFIVNHNVYHDISNLMSCVWLRMGSFREIHGNTAQSMGCLFNSTNLGAC